MAFTQLSTTHQYYTLERRLVLSIHIGRDIRKARRIPETANPSWSPRRGGPRHSGVTFYCPPTRQCQRPGGFGLQQRGGWAQRGEMREPSGAQPPPPPSILGRGWRSRQPLDDP